MESRPAGHSPGPQEKIWKSRPAGRSPGLLALDPRVVSSRGQHVPTYPPPRAAELPCADRVGDLGVQSATDALSCIRRWTPLGAAEARGLIRQHETATGRLRGERRRVRGHMLAAGADNA